MNTNELRRIALCTSLATDESIAKEFSDALEWSADEIDRLNSIISTNGGYQPVSGSNNPGPPPCGTE